MLFSKTAGALTSLAAVAAAAPPSLEKRQWDPTLDNAEAHCGRATFTEDYAYVIAFTERGNFAGINPHIESEGAVWLFNDDCSVVGMSNDWDGGQGAVVVSLDDGQSRNLGISVWMPSNTQAESSARPVIPTDIIFEQDNKQLDNDQTADNFNCDDPFSDSGFGYASYWRFCYFTPRGNTHD